MPFTEIKVSLKNDYWKLQKTKVIIGVKKLAMDCLWASRDRKYVDVRYTVCMILQRLRMTRQQNANIGIIKGDMAELRQEVCQDSDIMSMLAYALFVHGDVPQAVFVAARGTITVECVFLILFQGHSPQNNGAIPAAGWTRHRKNEPRHFFFLTVKTWVLCAEIAVYTHYTTLSYFHRHTHLQDFRIHRIICSQYARRGWSFANKVSAKLTSALSCSVWPFFAAPTPHSR